MNKFLLLSLFISNITYAADIIDGNTWNKLSEELQLMLIIGFDTGAREATKFAAMKAMDLDDSCTTSKIFNPNDKCLDKKTSVYNAITNKVENEMYVDRKYKDYADSISYIYSDPANREISWYHLISIVKKKYSGNDVSKDIAEARKYKSLPENMLKLLTGE